MAALVAINYDPAAAVSKATSSLLVMTAVDTTNLRGTFTVPANGSVFVRLRSLVTGATTYPRILLGVMQGATVKMKMSPMGQFLNGNNVATLLMSQEASGLVTGLAAGTSLTWDAAYGVDILLAATNLKYGGPNDAVGADAFGGFVFEVWEALNLLAGTLYDPTTSVTALMTSLLAMTALDTTNLRLTFVAPPSGKVLWRVRAPFHGSITPGSALLGILEGASVVARVAPIQGAPQTGVATACMSLEASGIITGLTPGSSHTYDAAYAVQVVAGAGGIKYGGPDNATTNDAFGGAAFEIWAA